MKPTIIQSYKRELMIRSTREPITGFDTGDNLFGSIASKLPIATNMDFIPQDGNGNVIMTGGNSNPQWKDLQTKAMQWWAYIYCSPLAAVIDKLSEADANGRLDIHDASGTPVKNFKKIPALNRIKNLLDNPNPMQTWQEFHTEQGVFAKIFGYCPVFAIGPVGMDKTHTKWLFNINPLFISPNKNERFSLVSSPNPIATWDIKMFGVTYASIPAEDILIIKDGFASHKDEFGLPISKIGGLDYMVSNICAAMEADNVLLKKKGPLGIFSHDPRPDLAGWQPMENTEKDELQDELKRYGLSWRQFQYVISRQPIRWNAMSFNVRDLMTKETVRQAIDGICDRFGYPAELMSGKNATYENRNSAEKFLYQNNIIPFSLRRSARYDKFFGLTDYKTILDYNHLPVLQEDIMRAGQASYAESQALDIDWKNGIITFNQYLVKKGYEPVAGMDIYYPEWAKQNGVSLNPNKDAKSDNKANSKSKKEVSSD